jgi:hypothetical protein
VWLFEGALEIEAELEAGFGLALLLEVRVLLLHSLAAVSVHLVVVAGQVGQQLPLVGHAQQAGLWRPLVAQRPRHRRRRHMGRHQLLLALCLSRTRGLAR